MARLPQPGSDEGNWGDILNDYLSQEHDIDGTHSSSNIKFKVDSISDLKNFDRKGKIEAVSVLGYYSPGDGGGDDFYWANGSIDTADGFMTIKSNLDATGRWKRNNRDGFLDIRKGGAKCDGTDNTKSIQNIIYLAISLATSTKIKQAIYIPGGAPFQVNGTLNIPSNEWGFTLFGDSWGASVIQVDGSASALLQIGDSEYYTAAKADRDTSSYFTSSNITIKNLHFINKNTSMTITAIECGNCTRLVLSKCLFDNFNISIDGYALKYTRIVDCEINTRAKSDAIAHIRLSGVRIGNDYTAGGNIMISNLNTQGYSTSSGSVIGILLKSAEGIYISNSHFQFCYNSMKLEYDNTTTRNKGLAVVKVNNCYFDDPAGGSPVAITGNIADSANAHNIHFVACYFRGATIANNGLKIDVTEADDGSLIENVTLLGCEFRTCNSVPIKIDGGVDLFKVSDCIFKSNNYGGSSSTSGATITAKQCMLSNNIFDTPKNATASVIRFTEYNGSSYLKAIGNVFLNDSYTSTAFITAVTTSRVDLDVNSEK